MSKVIEEFKKGSGIHIKKKNRGKFTSYCGGTVTNECIRKGKASSNPTIRKRATFAANVRKWKHQLGGTLDLSFMNPVINSSSMIQSNFDWNNGLGLQYFNNRQKLLNQKKQQDLENQTKIQNTISNLLGTAANTALQYYMTKNANNIQQNNSVQ